MQLIKTSAGDFPRPKPYVVELDDWTNFDRAWDAIYKSLAFSEGLQFQPDIPLSDLEVELLAEAHTRRGPWLPYEHLREKFPNDV